jgi:OFA family oxalate/formate antiporter-like MFS transporter
MSEASKPVEQSCVNHGWRVTFAGVGINLALGILYTWSVISKGIPAEWNWSETDKSLPYAIACLIFSLVMVPAGRMQDRIGPRIVASLGGLLVGLGMIVASMTTSPMGYILGFGVLAGAGIGFGYASATPPAVKWFSAAKTGMIAGIVVSGFGLASVYAAPLSNWLIAGAPAPDPASSAIPEWALPGLASAARAVQSLQHIVEGLGIGSGVSSTMTILGVAFLVVVVGLAQLMTPPPKGYVPAGTVPKKPGGPVKKEDFTPGEMLATPQFYLLWFMYACGAGAGLMVIAKLAAIGKLQAGLDLGFVLVAALALGNGAGRIVAGMASDIFGRKQTMFGCFLLQAVLIFVLSLADKGSMLATVPVLSLVSALIGANYGANLSLFPSITKDYYGLKNFGVNYGLVFTAWGAGGFMLALGAGKLYDLTGKFAFAYYGAMGLLVLAAIVTFLLKNPHAAHEAAVAAAAQEAVGDLAATETA